MKALLPFLKSKLFLYIIMAIGAGATLKMRSCQQKEFDERLQTYERQLSGQLTEKERELQSLNTELGLARSELMTQSELSKRLKRDKEELDERFEKFKKEHRLKISSRDRTIARLNQRINGGNTSTEVISTSDKQDCSDIESSCVIKYSWEDTLKRFQLTDPNIFSSGDETFNSSQLFKAYGEVYEQKDGSLKTRRMVLREVVSGEDGEYIAVPGGKAEIVDSDFEYYNPPKIVEKETWLDLFKLRVVALGTLSVLDDNKMRFGLGAEFFNVDGLGLNTHTAMDFNHISRWEHRLGVTYQPSIFNQDLNLAMGTSIGTPYSSFGQDWSFNMDILFYLHN